MIRGSKQGPLFATFVQPWRSRLAPRYPLFGRRNGHNTRSAAGVFFAPAGRPICFRSARARLSPALVRSGRRSDSILATQATMDSRNSGRGPSFLNVRNRFFKLPLWRRRGVEGPLPVGDEPVFRVSICMLSLAPLEWSKDRSGAF